MYKFLNLIIVIILLASLNACSTKLGRLFTVYKIDVQQGNAVEPEKVRQLEIGMTKSQVEYLLGTPMIADIFHPDRWDYIYYLIPDYGERQRRHVALFFEGDKVARIEEDDIPPPAEPSPEEEEQEKQEDTQDLLEDQIQQLDATSEDLEELQKEEGL
jgi:outer membrane protein assembly factor BamE